MQEIGNAHIVAQLWIADALIATKARRKEKERRNLLNLLCRMILILTTAQARRLYSTRSA
jgi:hypothetical protein